MPSRRRSAVLTPLVWLLASFATAALSHALIGLMGHVGLGDAYGEHAHATVAPVALAALSLVVGLLLTSALRGLGRSAGDDPVALLARRFGKMRPMLPCAAVATGGFVTLLAMEFSEQLSARGHIEGVSDALGGNVLMGLAIIGVVAALITVVGLRSAHALVSTVVVTACALAAWIVVKASPPIDRAAIGEPASDRRHTSAAAFRARCLGLRAPPPTLA